MYTTIEADIENGVLMGAELDKLPRKAHVLITLLDSEDSTKTDWSMVEASCGALTLREDSVEWQCRIRDEWD
jgi:hypothetical protein